MFNMWNCSILFILAYYVLSGHSRSQVGTNNIIRCTDDGEKNVIMWWLHEVNPCLETFSSIFLNL